MSTFEAYITMGAMAVSVSAVGAPLTVRSELAPVASPTVVLTVLLPSLRNTPDDEPGEDIGEPWNGTELWAPEDDL